MNPDYIVRVVIETETQCVEKRAYPEPDYPETDWRPSVIAEAILALDVPRLGCFLADIVRECCERGRFEASNVADRAAEERLIEAAYDVVAAWDKLDKRYQQVRN